MPEGTAGPRRKTGYERIEVAPLAGALGAGVRGADLARLDDETFDEIHRARLDHQMICFRDQDLTPDNHLAFACRCVHKIIVEGDEPF